MSILGNRNSLIDDLEEQESFKIPKLVTKEDNEMSLKKTIILSSILHPTLAGLIWLIVFIFSVTWNYFFNF